MAGNPLGAPVSCGPYETNFVFTTATGEVHGLDGMSSGPQYGNVIDEVRLDAETAVRPNVSTITIPESVNVVVEIRNLPVTSRIAKFLM